MANPNADFPTSVHTPTDTSGYGATALGKTAVKHTELEGKQEQEIAAMQIKIGTGASTPDSGKVLYSSAPGQSAWADLNDLVDILNNIISINGKVGVVVLNPDDMSDALTTNKFVTAAEIANFHAPGSDNQDLSNYAQIANAIAFAIAL